MPVNRIKSIPQRTRNLLWFLTNFKLNSGLLMEQVISVLEYLKSIDINLAILIWVINWNVEVLIIHKFVVFERMSLMLSEELPQILRNWLRPPRQHSAGVYAKAACRALNEWAIRWGNKGLKMFLKFSPLDSFRCVRVLRLSVVWTVWWPRTTLVHTVSPLGAISSIQFSTRLITCTFPCLHLWLLSHFDSWDKAMAQKSHFKMQTQGITKFRKTFPQPPGCVV